jgi:hypothetical protein
MAKILINCDEAHLLCTRDQYNDLNSKERFRYKLHNTHCLKCKSFDKKSRWFSKKMRGLQWVKLTQEQKNSIKDKVREAMRK